VKILYFLNAYEEDGPGLLMCQIASLLAPREGMEIYSAALSRGGSLEERFKEKYIPTHVIGMKGALDRSGYRALKAYLKDMSFDIVHTNILRADLFGRMAAHAVGVPVIISTEHGLHAWEHHGSLVRKFVKWFYLRTVSYNSAIVAVSDAVKESLIDEGIPREKIHRIYNGVDVNAFAPLPEMEKDKMRNYITDDRVCCTIGLVGNLVELKGLRYFIEALPPVFEKYPEALVVVVGEGPLRREMENEVSKETFAGRVKFLGKLSQITGRVMGALDVLVQPSLTESFGLTVAEALSCEVPVVASNVGGLTELIEDGLCGYLVPPRDSKALAGKIIDLLDDPDKRRAFGKAGRERITNLFQLSSTVEQYMELYKRLLQT